VPKRDRIELHRQTAAWLERRIDERPELAVTVADHLDRALSLAEEVAPLGPPDPALLESTVASLMRAGEWARTNAAVPEAITLFERAAEVGGEAPARARLALALAQAGRVDQAIETAEQAAEIDGSAEAKAVAALALAVAARSRANLEQMREHGERARCLASEASLPLVEADAIQLVALPAFWSGATLEAGDLYANAMEVASRVGDVALAAIGTVGAGFTSLVAGDLQAAEHRAEAASRLAVESGSLKTRGYALELVSDLRMVQDRLEESVAHTQEWLRLYAEGGDRVWVVSACTFLGERLQLLGRLDEAWAALEQGLAADAEIGVSAYIVNLRTRRARVLLEWGRVDDAETEVAHVAPERLEILDDCSIGRRPRRRSRALAGNPTRSRLSGRSSCGGLPQPSSGAPPFACASFASSPISAAQNSPGPGSPTSGCSSKEGVPSSTSGRRASSRPSWASR
jgi:tetratricopeptide (TPR) repeat protein